MHANQGRGSSRRTRNRRLLYLFAYLFGLTWVVVGEILIFEHDSSAESFAGIMRMFVVWTLGFPVMAFIVGPAVVKVMERAGVMDPQTNSAMGYEREVIIGVGREDISQVVVRSLSELRPKRIEKRGEEIIAVTKLNTKTLGEVVTIDLSCARDGRVRIRSYPRWELAIYDYGRNKDNVEKLAQGIGKAVE